MAEEKDSELKKLGFGAVIQRKPEGKAGERERLMSNTFRLDWNIKKIFRYMVEFEPAIGANEIFARRITLGRFHQAVRGVI